VGKSPFHVVLHLPSSHLQGAPSALPRNTVPLAQLQLYVVAYACFYDTSVGHNTWPTKRGISFLVTGSLSCKRHTPISGVFCSGKCKHKQGSRVSCNGMCQQLVALYVHLGHLDVARANTGWCKSQNVPTTISTTQRFVPSRGLRPPAPATSTPSLLHVWSSREPWS
jgi:hypothetical protein